MLPLSDSKRRKLQEALSLPTRASLLRRTLRIGDLDATELVDSLTYGGEENREGGSPAMTLECTLHGRLGEKYEGENVTVTLELGGVTMRTFTGFALKPKPGKTSTRLQAASAGFWLDKVALKEETEYQDARPSDAVYSVVGQRLPYEGLDIPTVPEPPFTRTDDEEGAEAFDETAKVSEVLAAVREEARLRVRDDGRGWLRGVVDDPLSAPGKPVFTWTVGEEIVLSEDGTGFEPELNPEDRYDHVWCYRTDEEGKIETLATKVYGARAIEYDLTPSRQLDSYEKNGFGKLPVCIAKTHLSISSDPALKGAPTGWVMPVREVRASVGAGFIYPICGDMRTMPGLSAHPAAESIDIDERGKIVGLS